MFERYTERARRVIFFARYEASRLGCSEITPEHLLLGLFREDLDLRQLVPSGVREQIHRTIDAETRTGDQVSTSVDLPLSAAGKRVLAYAAEESERLNHGYIGGVHMTVGLLREPSRASELLASAGLTLDRAREQASAASSHPESGAAGEAEPPFPRDPSEHRARLHALVNSLPDSALLHATLSLGAIRRTGAVPEHFREAREKIVERLRAQAAGGGSAVSFPGGTPASMRMRAGETVIESHRFHHGHEIALTERMRLSEDGRTLHYTVEVRGPQGSHTWSTEFGV